MFAAATPATTTPNTDFDPQLGLLCVVGDQLVPLFQVGAIDLVSARTMALSAIEAYEPESRADYVNVGRTIAFSMSALALLNQAAAQNLTLAEKLRAFGRANALNRSADISERTMMDRRRHQAANRPAQLAVVQPATTQTPAAQTPAGQPTAPRPAATPRPAALDPFPADRYLDDAAVHAAIAEIMATAQAATQSPAKSTAARAPAAKTATQADPAATQPPASTAQVPASAAPRSPAQPPANPPVSAFHDLEPPAASRTRPSPTRYRDALLRQSALHRVIEQAQPHPIQPHQPQPHLIQPHQIQNPLA